MLPAPPPPSASELETEDTSVLSRLIANIWSYVCEGFMARGGRYWLT